MERRRQQQQPPLCCTMRWSARCLWFLHCVAVLPPLSTAQPFQDITEAASSVTATETAEALFATNGNTQIFEATSVSPLPLLQPSSSVNLSWLPAEGLLLGSVVASDIVLWGQVIAPPWLAFVSASLPCDNISDSVFFTDDRSNYSSTAVSFRPKHSIRVESPLLKTVKGVYTVLGCLTACVQSKNFTCKSYDYFWKDGGRCSLYDFLGQEDDISAIHYSTTNDGADHYDLTGTANCSMMVPPYQSHNFATLGWQAFAIGWTELAIYEFDRAIQTNENSLTSYLGRTLCNDDFGFASSNGSYKGVVLGTVVSSDLTIHLSLQENLYFRALASLLSASNLTDGSAGFAGVIDTEVGSNSSSVVDKSQYALGLTLKGVAQLNVDLGVGADTLIQRVRSGDVTAMAYLTKRLDPYNNAPSNVIPLFDRAVEAATAFYTMYAIPNGVLCANLARSSVNVLEAYSRWTIAAQVAQLFSTPTTQLDELVKRQLLVRQKDAYYVKDTGLVFISRDEQAVFFERAHFHQLQAAEFLQVTKIFSILIGALSSSSSSFERAVAYRAIGTAYFVCAGAVYDSYAANLTFNSNASTDPATDDLSRWSIGYHQLAQYLRDTSSSDGVTTTASYAVLEQQLGKYLNATNVSSTYIIGFNMLLSIAKSRERESNGKMQEAVDAAQRGSMLQSSLTNASFLLPDVPGSKYFRQLLPIGHMYYGELLKRAYDSPSQQNKTGLVNEREAVLLSAVNWLPRNNSRSLLSVGILYSNDVYRPDVALQYLHALVGAWNSTGTTDRRSPFPGYLTAVAIIRLLESPPPLPCSAVFDVSVGCYGFWILIAIAIAAVVIVGVTVLVLRTRRRIRRPVKDKDHDNDFIFKGPQDLLSPDTNTLTTLYRYNNSVSAGSLGDAYGQEANGYYLPRAELEAEEEEEEEEAGGGGGGDDSEEAPEAPPPIELSNSTFAATTLERSQPPQAAGAKFVRVKRRDAPSPEADASVVTVTAGSVSTMERGFNVPKDFE